MNPTAPFDITENKLEGAVLSLPLALGLRQFMDLKSGFKHAPGVVRALVLVLPMGFSAYAAEMQHPKPIVGGWAVVLGLCTMGISMSRNMTLTDKSKSNRLFVGVGTGLLCIGIALRNARDEFNKKGSCRE